MLIKERDLHGIANAVQEFTGADYVAFTDAEIMVGHLGGGFEDVYPLEPILQQVREAKGRFPFTLALRDGQRRPIPQAVIDAAKEPCPECGVVHMPTKH